jgi:hypothetical protein
MICPITICNKKFISVPEKMKKRSKLSLLIAFYAQPRAEELSRTAAHGE